MNILNYLTFLGRKSIPISAISAITVTFGALGINPLPASAGAVIFNTGSEATATIALGVNDAGHLNLVDPFGAIVTQNSDNGEVGIAFDYPLPNNGWQDGTSPGCLCEGWGVSGTIGGTSYSGYAQVADSSGEVGVVNLTVLSFASDATSGNGTYATSSVRLTNIPLLVTQDYRVSPKTPDLFEDRVTITNNTGSVVSNLSYVRVMDWDVSPDEFNEYSTILGVDTTTFLVESHDGGFSSANPLTASFPVLPNTLNVNFVDSGPADHGAYFRFNFGSLAEGETRSFSVFYGATPTEEAANAAIKAAGIELFSYGQWSGDPSGGTPATYIWGFKDVGGTPYFEVPEPNLVLGLLAMGAVGLVLKRNPRP